MYPPCLATKRLVRLSLSQVRVSSTFSFYHFPLSPSCACVCLSSLSIREQTPSSSIVRFGRARGCCSTSGSQLDGSEVRLSSFHLARKLSARQGRAVWDSQSEQGCSPGRRSMRNPSVPTCTGCIRALCRERNPAQPLAPPASGSGAPTFRHAVRCPHPPCHFVLSFDHVVPGKYFFPFSPNRVLPFSFSSFLFPCRSSRSRYVGVFTRSCKRIPASAIYTLSRFPFFLVHLRDRNADAILGLQAFPSTWRNASKAALNFVFLVLCSAGSLRFSKKCKFPNGRGITVASENKWISTIEGDWNDRSKGLVSCLIWTPCTYNDHQR